jgi:hypothetical protein
MTPPSDAIIVIDNESSKATEDAPSRTDVIGEDCNEAFLLALPGTILDCGPILN